MKREPDCVWHKSIRGKMFQERRFRFSTGLMDFDTKRGSSGCERISVQTFFWEFGGDWARTHCRANRETQTSCVPLHSSSSGSGGSRRWITQKHLAGVFTYSWLDCEDVRTPWLVYPQVHVLTPATSINHKLPSDRGGASMCLKLKRES